MWTAWLVSPVTRARDTPQVVRAAYRRGDVLGVAHPMSWSRSFSGSSVRAAPGVEDQFTPGDRPSTGRLRYS